MKPEDLPADPSYLRLTLHTLASDPRAVAVKIIVFATYYQSLLVVAIPGMDDLGGSESWNDLLLCVEMALFAAMHMRVFSHKEFLPDGAIMARFARNEEGAPINVRTDTSLGRVCERMRDVASIKDVIADARRNFSSRYTSYIMQVRHYEQRRCDPR